MIRDFRFGATALEGDNYTKRNYSGIAYVWITLPDCKTVVDAYVLTGVVPTELPVDSLGFNVTDTTKMDISIPYAFDHIYWYKNPSGEENSAIKTAFESKLGSTIESVKQYYKKFQGE